MKHISPLIGLAALVACLLPAGSSQAVDCALATNTMYKAPGSRAVYYITAECQKQLVKSPEAYFSYASSWSEVRGANAGTLAAIPDHALRIAPWGPRRDFLGGTLIKSPQDPRIFLVSKYSANGQSFTTTLIPFDSERAFLDNGYQWNWIEDVAQSVITNTPISGNTITADWKYFPAGVLYKHPGSSALYLTRIGGGLVPSRGYVGSLDDLRNIQYRFDHVPNFPTWFPLTDTGPISGTINNSNPTQSTGPQDAATCADTNIAQSGSILICQGTTIRVNSFMSIRASVVSATEIVISLIKNSGSTQVWTIPVGQGKTGVFFEDPNNNFSISYDQYAFSSVRNKPVAYLRLTTAAIGSSSNNSNTNNTTQNCQSYSGQDSTYGLCANNTVYHNSNDVLLTLVSYTDEWATVSYRAGHPGSSIETGTMSIRVGQSGYVELPWLGRSMQVTYLYKDSSGRPNVRLYTTYNQSTNTNCSGVNAGGDGQYTICLGQQFTHNSSAVFKLKSIYGNAATVEINNVWETGTMGQYTWSVRSGESWGFRVIHTGGVIGEYLDFDIIAVGPDWITFRVLNN